MEILIATTSIFAFASAALLLNRILPFKVCPICAGVSGTWILMLAAKFSGYTPDTTLLAMLMGGSVVGTAYALEKHVPQGYSLLLWKMLFIPAGFIAAFSLINSLWAPFVTAFAFLAITAVQFTGKPRLLKDKSKNKDLSEEDKKIADLKKKMETCC